METAVYVDILLVLNYIVSLLLIQCTAKFSGISPTRRRIVAAALVGSLCSLAIFLPFMGFFFELLSKLLISAVMVRIALPYCGIRPFLGHWFVFFAVNFCFAGVMLAIWMMLTPAGMVYFNGVVYFDISALSLMLATAAAYLVLSIFHRLSRSGRLRESLCKVDIYKGGQMCSVTGLLDSGNTLVEPFSGAPVMVCWLEDISSILPDNVTDTVRKGDFSPEALTELGLSLRLVPFNSVGSGGVLPAFAPDKLVIHTNNEAYRVFSAYVAVSRHKISDGTYSALLNPEMTRIKIANGGAKR